MNQPRDFPEIDDEYARGALETERDALLVRVADLERDRTNLLRDTAYLNDRLEKANGLLVLKEEQLRLAMQSASGFYASLQTARESRARLVKLVNCRALSIPLMRHLRDELANRRRLFQCANRAKRGYRKEARALNQYSWGSRIDKGRTGDEKETGA